MITSRIPIGFLSATMLAVMCGGMAVLAGSMSEDPKGFHGIPWGTSLDNQSDLIVVNSSPHIKEYELKNGPLAFGEAKVDTMRFSTFDNKFARVTIRYRGTTIHTQVLAHLQTQYGPIDRTPGQMVRGLTQQYHWLGTDTEVNATFEGLHERGFVFIESAALAPRFNDTLPEHAY